MQPSPALQTFLEAGEEDFVLEVSRAAHEANGGAKKKLASTLQLFRDLGTSTANLVSGRSLDEEEDPEYLKAHRPFQLFGLPSERVHVSEPVYAPAD